MKSLRGTYLGAALTLTVFLAPAACQQKVFPVSVDVIPHKLKVRVFLHDIVNGGETISCWSYVTEGLMAHKQKEIIVTLRRNEHQNAEDYPHDFFELFRIIYSLAASGKLVDVGGITAFSSETRFMGTKGIAGLGYVEPEALPGVDVAGPMLAAILLKGDEPEIVRQFGITRVTALLGMKYRRYPYPVWSETKRDPVASLRPMQKTFLTRAPRLLSVNASYYEEGHHIFLSVRPEFREILGENIGQVPVDSPLIFNITYIDPRADACLVWSPNEHAPLAAITPPDSHGVRVTGSFLAFVPEQGTNEVTRVEDGHALLLTTSSWKKIREALSSGTNVSIEGANGTILSIEWTATPKPKDPGLAMNELSGSLPWR